MGEAYRGLTIRIGADSTPLQRNLSVIASAAKATQTQMRKLSQALRVDPNNLSLLEMKTRACGDNAKASASQYALLKRSLEQNAAKAGGLGRLAAATKNIESTAARLKNEYNRLDESLENVYNGISKYNRAVNGMTKNEAKTALRELRKEAKRSGNEVKILEKELRKVWESGKVKIPFDTTDVDVAIQKWKELRHEHQLAQGRHEAADTAVGIKNMSVNMELFRQEAKNANREMTEMRNKVKQLGSGDARVAAENIRLMEMSLEEAEHKAQKMSTAFKAMPKSIDIAKSHTKAWEEYATLLKRQIAEVQTRIKHLDGSNVEKIKTEFGTTANAVRVLTEREAEARTQADLLEAELDQINEGLKKVAYGSKSWDTLKAEQKRVKREQQAVNVELRSAIKLLNTANKAHAFTQAEADLARYSGKLATAEARMTSSLARIGQVGAAIRTAGYSMLATLGSGALMVGMYSIQAAKDVDSAYRNMRKTVNGTEEQFESLRRSALEFSQTHFTSADQLLEIQAIGGQLGISARNLEKFSEVVSSLDIATNVDTETMAQNLGQLSNIMNDMDQNLQSGPGSMEAYADALVRLGNNSAAQEDKIQNVMMRIASMGTISGMTTPDLLALATATAATGQGAEAAGTALSKTFSAIEGGVNGWAASLEKLMNSADLTDEEIEELQADIEKGAGKLEKFAEVAGMSSEEFSKAWNETPMEAFKAFIGGLKRIDAEGGSVDSTLTKLGITSVRQKQTLQGLVQTYDVLTNSLKMSNDAWNGISDIWGDAGDAAREAQRKSEGFSGQLQILVNNAKDLAVELTDSLVPILKGLTGLVKDVTSAVSALPGPIKTAISAIGGMAAMSGPLTIFVGSLMASGSTILDFFGKIPATYNKLGKVSGILGSAGNSLMLYGRKVELASTGTGILGRRIQDLGAHLTSPKLLKGAAVIGAIVVVANAAIGAYKKWKEHADMVERAHQTLGDRVSKAMGKSSSAIDNVKHSIAQSNDAIKKHKEYVEKLAESHEKLAENAEETFTKFYGVKTCVEKVTPILENLETETVLTASEFSTLSGYMSYYNELTGDTIQVTMNTDGAVRVLREGVDLTADAFRKLGEEAEIAAVKSYWAKEFQNSSEAVMKGKVDREGLVADRQKALEYLEDVTERYGLGSEVWTVANHEVEKLDASIAELDQTIRSESKSMDDSSNILAVLNSEAAKTSGTYENLVAKNLDLQASFATSHQSASDFCEQMRILGIDTKDLAGKEQELADKMSTWNGTAEDLIKKMEELGIDTNEARKKLDEYNKLKLGEKTVKFLVDTKAYDDFVNDLKNGNLITKTVKFVAQYDFSQANPDKMAKGGYVERLYASGGYFVDQPTVIGRSGNVTHIAGEAGKEYISRHAQGGMVLPLTDPNMRPWVDAVAHQMGAFYGLGIDYNAMASAIASQLDGMYVMMDGKAVVGQLYVDNNRRAAMNGAR